MSKEKVTAESLFRKTILPQQMITKKLYKNLIEGRDKRIHYIIALNKWFFHDKNRTINIRQCSALTNRSMGAIRVVMDALTNTFEMLNRNIIDNELTYTVRKNHKGKSQLEEIFKKHIEFQNSK